MDRRRALEVMGLNEDSTDSDIERRYYVLLKRYRTRSTTGETQGADEPSMEEITEAYNFLMRDGIKEEEYEPSPVFKKLNVDERKVRNFLHYHKWHIVVGIIAIIAIVSFIKGILQPRPDFNIAFIGEILYYDGAEIVEKKVETEIESVSLAAVDGASFLMPEMEHDMTMKAMVLLAAADVDVFITDMQRFNIYAQQGAFLKLEDTVEKLGVQINEEVFRMSKTEDDDRRYLYGIDVSDSKLLNEAGIFGDEMIFSIKVNTKNYDKALEFLKMLLRENGE